MTTQAAQHDWRKIYFSPRSIPFWGVHVTAIVGIAMLGWSWTGLGLAIAAYYARMFFVTGAYHRYFSHRTYKTSRPFQFLLALFAVSSVQQGVLWWSSHHRTHHRESDKPGDVHSPVQRGFWWAHVGWILGWDHKHNDFSNVSDLTRYRELWWLERFHLVPGIALAVALYFIGGAHALIWGYFVSTTLLWHGTFTINSLSHVWGKRRYDTEDQSRNNWALALLTMGEGWHNNHHHYQTSCRQGFRWYEVDVTYYILRAFEKVGLIWDMKTAPDYIVANQPKPRRVAISAPAPARLTVAEPSVEPALDHAA